MGCCICSGWRIGSGCKVHGRKDEGQAKMLSFIGSDSINQRGNPVAAVTIRDLADETHRALKVRAKAHGRSAEAEMRAILDEVVRPAERIKLGTEIRKLVEKYGGFDLDIERDQTPPRYPDFSGPEWDFLDVDQIASK